MVTVVMGMNVMSLVMGIIVVTGGVMSEAVWRR